MDSKSQRPLCSRGEWPERKCVCLWAWLPWILCSRLCSPVLTLWKPESLGSDDTRDSEEEEPWEEGVWPGREDMASVSASEKGSLWWGLSGPQPSPLSSSLRGRYPRRRSDCHGGRQLD